MQRAQDVACSFPAGEGCRSNDDGGTTESLTDGIRRKYSDSVSSRLLNVSTKLRNLGRF